jgi:hypothetical protein
VVDDVVDAPEMITFFNIHGAMVYLDEAGHVTGYEDVFSKMDLCRKHYAPVVWVSATWTDTSGRPARLKTQISSTTDVPDLLLDDDDAALDCDRPAMGAVIGRQLAEDVLQVAFDRLLAGRHWFDYHDDKLMPAGV